jgi:predicted transcriptional regulator
VSARNDSRARRDQTDRRILRAVKDLTERRGPTVAEIAAHLGVTRARVWKITTRLVKEGKLSGDWVGKVTIFLITARGWTVLEEPAEEGVPA